MMLKCIGSGSAGNCYLFEADGETLIVECGLPFADIQRALGFDFGNVVGCLISHRHKDHSFSLKTLLQRGIKTLALADVFESQGIRNKAFCKEIQPNKGYMIGSFKVYAMDVAHDAPCLGFIIEHGEMGRTLFVTDTMMLEYRIPKIDHLMIEANYADDILQANIDCGVVPSSMRWRLMHSHMEIGTLKDIVRANDLSDVNEVILLHLSGNNSDSERFCKEIRKVSGKPTYVARKGFEIELMKTPY